MLVDSHAHYDDGRFDGDRDETIQRVYSQGVGYIINPSTDLPSAKACLDMARKYPFLYTAVGIHPHCCGNIKDDAIATLAEMASDEKVVAIGETGLDYYYENSPREIQKSCFIEHIKLAADLDLPLIIHNRDSHKDVLEITRKYCSRRPAGVFHMFSGSAEMAALVVDMGFYIGIGGVVTFKNARKIIEVVKTVPEDRLLIETDCPYMAPEPYRGRRNDSGMLVHIVEKIANIKGSTYEKIAEITSENAIRLFALG
jgi:TatD DNase family protein